MGMTVGQYYVVYRLVNAVVDGGIDSRFLKQVALFDCRVTRSRIPARQKALQTLGACLVIALMSAEHDCRCSPSIEESFAARVDFW